MGSHRATTRALVVVGVFVTAAAGSAGQTRLDGEVFQRFRLAVDAYVAVHREVEQHVPPLEMSSDATHPGAARPLRPCALPSRSAVMR